MSMTWDMPRSRGQRRAVSTEGRQGRMVGVGFAAVVAVAVAAIVGPSVLRGGQEAPPVADKAQAEPAQPAVEQAVAKPAQPTPPEPAIQSPEPAVQMAEAPPAAKQPWTPDVPRVKAADLMPVNSVQQVLPAGSARFGPVTPARTVATANKAFSALSFAAGAAPVAVAETESQIVEMESKLAAEGADEFALAAAPADASAADTAGMTSAQTLKYVNLRAGPDNDATVLTIVPANAEILAQADCSHWCSVVYDGRQGYIYKSFIGQN
jgi:Bacterial SH3 domain